MDGWMDGLVDGECWVAIWMDGALDKFLIEINESIKTDTVQP